jgi:hypothetical protein
MIQVVLAEVVLGKVRYVGELHVWYVRGLQDAYVHFGGSVLGCSFVAIRVGYRGAISGLGTEGQGGVASIGGQNWMK